MIHYRTCPLCEATCGLEIHTEGNEIISIRGDKLDPFSKGHICPKGYSLKELHEDPDRLRKPLVRNGTDWKEVSWQEALSEVKKGLRNVIHTYGRDAVAVYLGNPNVHNLAGLLYVPTFLKTLRSKNTFSASTMDQIPKQLVADMMYGSDFSVPIPDVDHTDYMLIIGANPFVSNGSMMTAPNMKERLKNIQARGGKFVVIDPLKTPTAKAADEYYPIQPGTDALFLFALVNTIFDEKLVRLGKLEQHTNDLEKVKKLAESFSPEAIENTCDIPAMTIRKIARDLANAEKAIVYGRMGTCTQEFGTLSTWLIDVLNILTGNLDSEGGVCFPKPAVGARNVNKPLRKKETYRYGRFYGAVSGLPEVLGELPVSTLADELDHAKAFVTIGGNPILSTPNGKRLQTKLRDLDFIVSVDCYLNESTRFANVILPVPSPLERSHYDVAFYHLAVRNIAHYSKPVFDLPALDEWEVLLHLTEIVSGTDMGGDPVTYLDDMTIQSLIRAEVKNPKSPIYKREPEEIFSNLSAYRGPERMLDFLLRVGPYGDGFGRDVKGLNLETLKKQEHGVDLGPLKERIPEVLLTSTQKIELAPEPIIKDIPRLHTKLKESLPPFVLIGRRDLRSNNSWMHNLDVLVKGKNRCTLYMNPHDAMDVNIEDGDAVKITSRVGTIEIDVKLQEDIKRGVVSIPHGWGHQFEDTRMQIARKHAGVNVNDLSDSNVMDAVSGNAVFNGIPVNIEKILVKEGEEKEWQSTL
ncbi:molybdopterin oxidoreductase family protein [Bacillus sp. HMF5848]|uniref:molybdopterin-dependent oxidoreductase n=1 Tax=Bacillus sp. HMF5848 TaxID=2495421 RepID=UPI000F78D6F1|nr:molybdopterin-dependent oxidoreductase [Bacillus sp. HMF5848]RSK29100.1 molybdopterin oxidoreductase family protein [Bacillus sp. HMF5848]